MIAAKECILRHDVMSAICASEKDAAAPSILELHLVIVRLSFPDSQFGLGKANVRL